MTVPLCVIHPTRQAPPALPDTHACGPCAAGLETDLADIHRLLPTLRGMLEPARTGPAPGGRRPAGSAPLNLGAVALLDPRNTEGPDVVLARWARAATLPPTAAHLRSNLGWFLEQDPALVRAFAREIRGLAGELREVCGPAHAAGDAVPAARRVATCRRETRPGRECGGAITAAPGDDFAVCQRCREGWPRERWAFLARLQES